MKLIGYIVRELYVDGETTCPKCGSHLFIKMDEATMVCYNCYAIIKK